MNRRGVNLNELQKNRSARQQIRRRKVRSTLVVCEERFACKGDKPEASFHCAECGTDQCECCSFLIHQNSRYRNHRYLRLDKPPVSLLCQNNCAFKNLADIWCLLCELNYCFDCERLIHRSVKHPIEPFENQIVLDENTPKLEANSHVNFDQPSTGEKKDCKMGEIMNSVPTVFSPSKWESLDSDTEKYEEAVAILPLESISAVRSFCLIDEYETICVHDSENFCNLLGIPYTKQIPVKVVSIFGNTGEGKSFTLNQTFFSGQNVFKTSPSQSSCTVGVWAAYDESTKTVVIDTEGLLGVSENCEERTRLLLKIIAISDVIIYRTRSQRLTNDLFTFLGHASQAFTKHFVNELKNAIQRCHLSCSVSDLGPVVIISHETTCTEILKQEGETSPEDYIRQRFSDSELSISAYSGLEYIGHRRLGEESNYEDLRQAILRHLRNTTVRSPKLPSVIYSALDYLNDKFSGQITESPNSFPDEYFTCNIECLSCQARCILSMNHIRDGKEHCCESTCQFQYQYENRISLCGKCYDNGREIVVQPKSIASNDSSILGTLVTYAWSGYVLECERCGLIYHSRKYWYGNEDPQESCVKSKVFHVWPGQNDEVKGMQHTAQKVIDGVSYLSETVSSIGSKPTQILKSWIADQVAPSYWVPNSQILKCQNCDKAFEKDETKHHCRACGQGFCEDCCNNYQPVPERGWGDRPVKVCANCFMKDEPIEPTSAEEVKIRQLTEAIQTTLGSVAAAIDYPLEFIKESARPDYWVSDKEIKNCFICEIEFNEKNNIHHCRFCGNGVCNTCSPSRKPLPCRGWYHPVRVCNTCISKSFV